MKSYESVIRYLAGEQAQIRQMYDAKQSNYLAGAYEISEALGNQLHDMMSAQKEHVHMVSYIYGVAANTVYRDVNEQAEDNQ